MPPDGHRRLGVGAELLPGSGVHFRVWAPGRRRIEVVGENRAAEQAGPPDGDTSRHTVELEPEGQGYFSGTLMSAEAGSLYWYRLDGRQLLPDPASRFQPMGPSGPSEVIDPQSFRWSVGEWSGLTLQGQVIYEMHIGTFTQEGTWEAAGRELVRLAELGITVIQLMPVADFPGRFGWGYDGVCLFAPTRLYGRPDDFRRFVDTAHSLGLGVILDVVYNHVGPEHNYLEAFSADYFQAADSEWGRIINYDGENSGPVRDFYLANVCYWVEEFHLDGFRFDATHWILDSSPEHILSAMGGKARSSARGRELLLVAENELQQVRMVRSSPEGGYGLDALLNDDFHHSARVALTGQTEAYYGDYRGAPQEFISAAKRGLLFQGQHNRRQDRALGSATFGLQPARFVHFLQNHDQVANTAFGRRIHQLTSPGRYRALTALLLLAPQTPLLFQGQEFAASAPFLFFADHNPQLNLLILRGRREFLARFPSQSLEHTEDTLPDPSDLSTFLRCKLDHTERETHGADYHLVADLLRLRREDAVFRAQRTGGLDGAVLCDHALVLRFFGMATGDRLLLVNLGRELNFDPAPEPLLAPPAGCRWTLMWSSEDPRYGGGGLVSPCGQGQWRIPAEAALVMEPQTPSGSGTGAPQFP